eukprot:CAMPEP_0113446602 /NCGR_PEP_ID=MMETSP0014_2-20120614/3797_1 /TAXON_ID=2857 /ORGANISM="Nitzschia sp." /LENGTH=401 /DNA_ID=CAMNT_0000337711 /DNA_START=270 /DNA_END=1475 /DNA_ORIENTATION=+ /assembly_acc=CAM_ASM_000159
MMESQESNEKLKGMNNANNNFQATNDDSDVVDNDDDDFLQSSLEELNTMLSSSAHTKDSDKLSDVELAAVEAAIEEEEKQNGGSEDPMTSLAFALDDLGTPTTTANNSGKSKDDSSTKQEESTEKQETEAPSTSAEVVPIQQFLNAMTIIQDLESRVALLEKERSNLLEENSKQKVMIDAYEQKLSEFPQMMEEQMAENDKIVAKVATEVAKVSYWDQHMKKEEAKHAKEIQVRTDTLQQSDFLADIVARKEVENRHLSSKKSLWKRLSSVSLPGKGQGERGSTSSSSSIPSPRSFGGGIRKSSSSSGGGGAGGNILSNIMRTASRDTSVGAVEETSTNGDDVAGKTNSNSDAGVVGRVGDLNGGVGVGVGGDHFTIDDDEDDDEIAQNTSTDDGVLDLIS